MKQFFIYIMVLSAILAVSCSDNHQAAEQHLANARSLLMQNDFEKAKAELDSINTLYPKSFEQRKAAVPLLDSIRKAENNFLIANVDTQLAELQPILDKLKADFVYQKDAKYQETGSYVPKATAGSGVLAYTTLHSGVEEDGRIYLESIFIGAQKHNQLKVIAGNQSAESLVVEGDGYIHRFTDLGKSYEVIRIIGANENGVAKFIAENAKTAIKVQLTGSHTASYTLPQNIKNAIEESYTLSSHMLLMDSLKTEKEKAEFKNFYLDNGKQVAVPVVEE